MEFNKRLTRLFRRQAEEKIIKNVTIGLGYTSVQTSDDGMGIAYTYFDDKRYCSAWEDYYNYENRNAAELLEKMNSENTIERSLALALINALNFHTASQLPEDRSNSILLESLKFRKGMNVAMVGHIKPLEKIFLDNNAQMEIIDTFNQIGSEESFYPRLKNWADILIITSSAILNNTLDNILIRVGPKVKMAILGPGTPMVNELLEEYPLCYLGGTVPVEREDVLRLIRHGMGTRLIHKHSRKVYLKRSDA